MNLFRRSKDTSQSSRSSGSAPLVQSQTKRASGSRIARRKSSGGSSNGKTGFQKLFTLKWIGIVFATAMLLVVGMYVTISAMGVVYPINKLDQILASSVLEDADGKKIPVSDDEYRDYISLDDIKKVNPLLPQAFVKVEDNRFYEHKGVDYWSMGRAMVTNLIAMEKRQGGSTLTMQVAGNVILNDRKKTFSRKLMEIGTAWNLELEAGKDKILEAYLNYISFGGKARGIKAASLFYFNKDISKDKLEVAEIAYLAGLPKAPTRYCGFCGKENAERGEKRAQTTLYVMSHDDDGAKPIITTDQYEKAKKHKFKWTTDYRDKYLAGKSSQLNSAFITQVKAELKEDYGYSDEEVENLSTLGLQIKTRLNQNVQKETQEALNNLDKTSSQLQGGTVTLDKDGYIVAIGGGKNYKPGDLNKAFSDPKQPGSSIKPLTVFAPAMDLNKDKVNPYTTVEDRKQDFGGGYSPDNADGREHGTVPLQEVAKKSYNLGTLDTLQKYVGVSKAFQYTEKLELGLDPKTDKNMGALGLGGVGKGVTPLQMAQAYTAFPNNGVMKHARTIVEVQEPADGKLKKKPLEDKAKKRLEDKKIYEPQAAYYTHKMLQEVVKSGTATGVKSGNQPVAGKTGTTNENKVAWFVGYTPRYVTAVMVYNTKPEKKVTALSGGRVPVSVFNDIIQAAEKGQKALEFTRPDGVKDPDPPFELSKVNLTGNFDSVKNEAILNWSVPQDMQTPRVRYEIYRIDGGEKKVQDAAFSDTSIRVPLDGESGNSFQFKVKVIDGETGQSVDSNTVTVTPSGSGEQKESKKDKGFFDWLTDW
ncbi:membrane peptidoglycan carboxypeptidase [Croceifilum oryzae]|uniref:Membrane peptidoglycan carboxypeptidase n=1 Tax=Croceifilum oryzae TaxID=1553429 RepID=A0AAJ1TCR6_9BACL|nr:transglycosylase domain-containing protein [Croceifilum oryzae]MDQ0416129.1 membrane peptidoglycan carboxypeptidase [Croceifilum oryzae]